MTDPEEVALYRAILADPHEDTARLVYADWLDEHGDAAHAEFLRVQCRLARTPAWGDGHAADRVRGARLLRELGTKWCRAPGAPAAADGYPNGFFVPSRGLAGGTTVFLDQVSENRAKDWFACRPIASARFYFDPGMGDRRWLLTTDALPALRTLWLELGRFCPIDLVPVLYRTLAHAKARSALTRLELNGPIPFSELDRLVTSRVLQRLEVLSFTGSDLDDDRAGVLARKMNLPALRELTFARDYRNGPDLTPDGAGALGRAEWLPRLTALRVWGCGGLGSAGVTALLGGRPLPELRTLDVRNCQDTRSAVAKLVRGPGLPGLRELALSGDWNAADWLALTGGPQELQSLSLGGTFSLTHTNKNVVSGADAAFFDRPALRDLRRLELSGVELNAPVLARLARSPLTGSLRWLAFRAADGVNPLTQLVDGAAWSNLEYLQIDNPVPGGALLELLAGDRFPRLVGLKAGIGSGVDEFVEGLSALPAAARLRELDLGSGFVLTPATAAALAESPYLGDIDRLYVNGRGLAPGVDYRRLTERFGARVEIA